MHDMGFIVVPVAYGFGHSDLNVDATLVANDIGAARYAMHLYAGCFSYFNIPTCCIAFRGFNLLTHCYSLTSFDGYSVIL